MKLNAIYFDANASSRPRPAAIAAVQEMLAQAVPANPSSVHIAGRFARAKLDDGRRSLLRLLRIEPTRAHLIFTSGGTEACNSFVYGFTAAGSPGRIVTTALEHPAVGEPCSRLERSGWKVVRVRPETNRPETTGIVDAASIVGATLEDSESSRATVLVTLMAASNETGAIQPVAEIAKQLRAAQFTGAICVDATQAFGKSYFDGQELFDSGVDAMALSAHKMGAFPGIGALVVNNQGTGVCREFVPLLVGGPQEQRFRAGTENVIAAAAWGAVADVLEPELEREIAERSELRDHLWSELSRRVPCTRRITPPNSICNTLTVRFPGCRGDDLVVALDLAGVCASTGSACSSGRQTVSPSLVALGLTQFEAREVVRFSLDWDCTAERVDDAARIIEAVVNRMLEINRPVAA